MAMSITQVRLPEGIVRQMDTLVDDGLYTSKSDIIREALRRLFLERFTGVIPDKGNSVNQVRALRKKLSAKRPSMAELNRLVR